MLAKEKRLNLKQNFSWVRSGSKLETKYLRLFLKTAENTTAKVGITSPSKVFKKAVERNRARRLASAAFEDLYPRLHSNINIVALPKLSILSVKSSDILSDLEQNLKNENIIN